MADHFQGNDYVELQPGDINYPVKFRFNPASASTKNDGAMPYGSTVKTVVTTIKDDKGISATSVLLSSSSISANTVILYLKYSTGVANGRYTITSKVNFSLSGSTRILTKEFDFRRLYLRNE